VCVFVCVCVCVCWYSFFVVDTLCVCVCGVVCFLLERESARETGDCSYNLFNIFINLCCIANRRFLKVCVRRPLLGEKG